MGRHALFEGLISDEYDRPVAVARVGEDAVYVIDDDGFMRHVDSEHIDRQVLEALFEFLSEHEEIISLGAMEMLGESDPFTKAAIDQSLAKAPQQMDAILEAGLPEAARMNLGLVGFRVIVDYHGDLLELIWPEAEPDSD